MTGKRFQNTLKESIVQNNWGIDEGAEWDVIYLF